MPGDTEPFGHGARREDEVPGLWVAQLRIDCHAVEFCAVDPFTLQVIAAPARLLLAPVQIQIRMAVAKGFMGYPIQVRTVRQAELRTDLVGPAGATSTRS